jgi:hypothetical protein
MCLDGVPQQLLSESLAVQVGDEESDTSTPYGKVEIFKANQGS